MPSARRRILLLETRPHAVVQCVQATSNRRGARSDLRSAAINEEFDARDKTRVIRCQK